MSAVERALKKLSEARASNRAEPRTPIAQVTVDVADDGSRHGPAQAAPAPRKTIEFDLDALARAGLVSEANRALAEQYRMIKQPILKKAVEHSGDANERFNLVMVGSALAGEGKTFTCVNLSLSLATEKDWEVLLIDVDCKNPQLSRLLGVENEPGLLEVLKDKSIRPESLIMATSIAGLTMLPLGKPDEHATELLASARMSAICAELAIASPRRISIFDSPPLLMTTEPAVLAGQIGQVVLVVLAGKTPRQAVADAVTKLDPSTAIGLVLNGASEAGETSRYGGYDSYPYPTS